jgi:hypothetical protein
MEATEQTPQEKQHPTVTAWQAVTPSRATLLTDARVQFHYAAQFATAGGISYLRAQPDDSHTNLEWIPEFQALFSRPLPAARPFRIGARPADLALLLVPQEHTTIAEFNLDRCTIADAVSWLRSEISAQGADPERYTLKRHYEIPLHPVASGEAFDATDRPGFEELSKWFADAASILNDLARKTPQTGEVRCWPHHFDIGMLIQIDAQRSIGVGLEPGDDYYAEPYFYVNMSPQPSLTDLRRHQLRGNGSWHTSGWIGAVLPGSRLGSPKMQEAQVSSFLESAIGAARQLIDHR